MTWLDSVIDAMNMCLGRGGDSGGNQGAWRAVVHGVAKSQTPQLNNSVARHPMKGHPKPPKTGLTF